jgi:hypothetical protein
VVADCLRTICESGSPELEAGFGEILTDVIGGARHGSVPHADFYEEEV